MVVSHQTDELNDWSLITQVSYMNCVKSVTDTMTVINFLESCYFRHTYCETRGNLWWVRVTFFLSSTGYHRWSTISDLWSWVVGGWVSLEVLSWFSVTDLLWVPATGFYAWSWQLQVWLRVTVSSYQIDDCCSCLEQPSSSYRTVHFSLIVQKFS